MYKILPKLVSGMSALLFATASCVNDSYDLNKDISLDISAGGSEFSIPVGYTDSVLLGDLIDESGVLTTDETGQYVIRKSDQIDPVGVQIDPVLIDNIEVNLRFLELDFISGLLGWINFPPGVVVTIPELTAPVFQTGSFRIDAKVPDELVSVKTVELDPEKAAVCRFTLKLQGMPQGIGNMTLDDFKVIMPDFLKFAESDQMADGVLLLDGVQFSPYVGFSRGFTVTGADFTKMNNSEGVEMQQINGENWFILNSAVIMSGKLKIGRTTIAINDLKGIALVPELTVASIEVQKFTGLVDHEIDPVKESIAFELDEDLDFLRENDVMMELHNPQISLVISNTIGIPVDMRVNMYAKNRQGAVIEGSLVENITLPVKAAETDGAATKTGFLISRKGTEKEGYEAVRVENLSNLMKILPDSVVFEMTAKANQEQTHHIDLKKTMQVTGSYEVSVPLQFDTLHVNYSDTIKGLADDLSDVSDKLRDTEVQLLMEVENTIPAGLNIEIVPLNAKGEEITGMNACASGTVKAGNGYEVTKTSLTVDLNSEGDKLSQLEALALRITVVNGSHTGGSVPLNANQFICFKGMRLKSSKGFSLDLNK